MQEPTRKKAAVVLAGLMLFLGRAALADDVPAFRPCWRGATNTTFQSWQFTESNNPAAVPPDSVANPFGAPQATVVPGPFSSGYIASDPFLGCAQGIWDLGQTGKVALAIPNLGCPASGSYKYVQAQLTQYRDGNYNASADVSIAGGTLAGRHHAVVATNSFGGQWLVEQTVWRLGPPSPPSETIVITAAPRGSLIDQVVVDTLVTDFPSPAIGAIVATQPQAYCGVVDVKDCAATVVQGLVNMSVQASGLCSGVATPPSLLLTNGTNSASAVFASESPSGTFGYTWSVTPATACGTWTATVVATDAAGNAACATFTLGVNTAQIYGQVQLEGFTGAETSPPHGRTVTFVATTNSTVLKTWNLPLTNATGDTFAYTLTDVPPGTSALSAKTPWNLRVKLAVTPDSQGQAVANFLADEAAGWNSATDHYLRGGDLNGDNIVNVSDYNLMAAYWFDLVSVVPAAALADITGDGVINLFEYAMMGDNWLQAGDPQ